MEKHKSCCVIGHKEIDWSVELEERVEKVVEDLIVNFNVTHFLFGSKSEFNALCHKVVTRLKEKYPQIKRICYPCSGEGCVMEEEKLVLEAIYSKIADKEANFMCFDGKVEKEELCLAGKASYIKRNQAMIDDSDFCVFYFDSNRQSQNKMYRYRKSGTALAYDYAKKQNKKIANLFH